MTVPLPNPALCMTPLNDLNAELDAARLLLPVEVLEKIVQEAWAAPQTVDERITLFTSLTLVSRTMLSIFMHVALRDVHVTTPQFALQYVRMLRTRTSDEADDDYLLSAASSTANRLCRTLTFHVDAKTSPLYRPAVADLDSDDSEDTQSDDSHWRSQAHSEPAIRLYSDGNKEAEAVSTTLYMLDLMHTSVPNLRRVSVAYYDWGFDDVFDQCRILPMPKQVTDLEVNYSFSKNLSRVAYGLRRRWGTTNQHCTRWNMVQTRRLVVHGAPARFVSALLETVPNVETLEVDDHVKLTQLRRDLPNVVRSLVLRRAIPPRHDEGADSWQLTKSLKRGPLFTHPKDYAPSRALSITLEGAGPNTRSRERLRRACESTGVNLQFVE